MASHLHTAIVELEIVTIFFLYVSFIRIASRMVRSTYFVLQRH